MGTDLAAVGGTACGGECGILEIQEEALVQTPEGRSCAGGEKWTNLGDVGGGAGRFGREG